MDTIESHAARRGPASVLTLRHVALADPGPGQVRVKIEAAGVAYADIVMRNGLYSGARPPVTPGYDFVGLVEEIGPGVTGLRVGQRVAGVTVLGSYADRRNVDADILVPAPESADPAVLVAAVLNGVTAWQILHRLSAASTGDAVLVHGAAGGVGSLLLELAARAGLRVIGSASAGKAEFVAARGAIAVDYRGTDVAAEARRLSDGGVAAAFDHIGGSHLSRATLAALRPGGVAISYGGYDATRGGRIRPIAIADYLFAGKVSTRKLFEAGQSVVTYSAPLWRDSRRAAYRADLATVLELVASGALTPHVAARFPLAEAAEAQRALESRSVVGKIVLVP